MKNITLKIDDETYQRARVRAAKAGTSVSAMVREFLNRDEYQEVASEARRIAALNAWYATIDERDPKASEPVKPLTREEIYATRIRSIDTNILVYAADNSVRVNRRIRIARELLLQNNLWLFVQVTQ